MEKYFHLIHDVDGSAYEIRYTLFPINRVFPMEMEVENLEFWKITGTFKSRDKTRIW